MDHAQEHRNEENNYVSQDAEVTLDSTNKVISNSEIEFKHEHFYDLLDSFGSHVPHRVLDQVISSALEDESDDPVLPDVMHIPTPYHFQYDAALLFIDISGFSALSSALDAEPLGRIINGYFDLIVNECEEYRGDVLKFAGDAIFVEWTKRCDDENSGVKSLEEALVYAASCGASIIKKFSDHKALHPKTLELITYLNVHCGLGVGKIANVHVGTDYRRELIILGNPIDQVAKAEGIALNGELVASPEAIDVMSKLCDFSEDILQSGQPEIIANRTHSFFTPRDCLHIKQRCSGEFFNRSVVSMYKKKLDIISPSKLLEIVEFLSLYVHRVARGESEHHDYIDNDEELLDLHEAIQARHVAEAELRNVYTVFISPKIEGRLTGDPKNDRKLFYLLNDIISVVVAILHQYKGDLRQFIWDDKGVVLIANFGLRGSTFPNQITERCLPATLAIHDALNVTLRLENTVGGTLGRAYCGVIGGVFRHEYSILGSSVNLAARLMCSPVNPGVLVDESVLLQGNRRFRFRTLNAVKAKGYKKLVPIYEPESSVTQTWQKTTKQFVGRVNVVRDINSITKKVLEAPRDNNPARLVFVHAESGFGKSSAVYKALLVIRQSGRKKHKKIQIATSVVNDENERLVPFSGFRSAFLALLGAYSSDTGTDMKRRESGSSSISLNSLGTPTFFDVDDVSMESQSLHRDTRTYETFLTMCETMNRSAEWAQNVGKHLLGLKTHTEIADMKIKQEDVVEFLVDASELCAKQNDLTVIAIDDVHWMDSMTWKVLHQIYLKVNRIVLVLLSRPLTDYKLEVEPEFWDLLQGEKNAIDARFVEIEIKPLNKSELRLLIAKEHGVNAGVVEESICDHVFHQTGGIPYFVTNVCFEFKRQGTLIVDDRGMLTWSDAGAKIVEESKTQQAKDFLLYRIEKLVLSRKVLSYCALLGLEFTLSEISMVVPPDSIPDGQDVRMMLQEAVSEDILEENVFGVDYEDIKEERDKKITTIAEGDEDKDSDADSSASNGVNVVYRFRHGLWRTSIIGTMLLEWKKEMHKAIATAYETRYEFSRTSDHDTRLMLKVFNHWIGAAQPTYATSLAHLIGKIFGDFNLKPQLLSLYEELIKLWKSVSHLTNFRNSGIRRSSYNIDYDDDDDEGVRYGGIHKNVLDVLEVKNVEELLKLLIACANTNLDVGFKQDEAVEAYENAMSLLENVPAASQITNRTFILRIFSGMGVLMRSGKIKRDNMKLYEQDFISKFVKEASLHADPVHLLRATAMQAESWNRYHEVEKALGVFENLKKIYDVDKHSNGVASAYGTDRAGQTYGLAALWMFELGRKEMALEQCEFVLENILPKMDIKNVHNSYMTIYPIHWVFHRNNMSLRSRDLLQSRVVDAYHTHYDKGATTVSICTWDILLNLFGIDEILVDERRVYKTIDFTLNVGNINKYLNIAFGAYGRDIESCTSELCLKLARHMASSGREGDNEKKELLVKKGLEHAIMSEEQTKPQGEKLGSASSYRMLVPILKELRQMSSAS